MNGPEHYLEAERLVTEAATNNPGHAVLAQTHAALALVALLVDRAGSLENAYEWEQVTR